MAQDWTGHVSGYPHEDAPKLPERIEEGKQIGGLETGGLVSPDDPKRFLDPMDGGCVFPAPVLARCSGECEKPWLPDAARFPGTRWGPADLDRCEHGRHSIDSCFDCPAGESSGNPFLINQRNAGHTMRTRDGRTEVRIGTMVRGEPIWVVVRDKPRESGT
jgi:hypothetical protein